MMRVIDKLLEESPKENQERRQATAKYARAKHSQYHRMKEMLRLAEEYREARGLKMHYRPELKLFLPEVPWAEEKQHALKGWA
jgi:methyl coenzyme M reductase alpha subunit